jgi:hypothetical protein
MAFRQFHITGTNGVRVDITSNLQKILWLDNRGRGDLELSEENKQLIRQFGTKLIMVAGIEEPFDLVDELFEEGDISHEFAAYLRSAWMPLIAEWALLDRAG